MALQIATIANSIAALTVAGLVIKDIDEIPAEGTVRTPMLLPLPNWLTDFEMVRDSYGAGDTAKMTVSYTLNYRLLYAPAGAGRNGIIDLYDDMIDMVALILDEVLAIVQLAGAIDCVPAGVVNMGVVNDPAEAAYFGAGSKLPRNGIRELGGLMPTGRTVPKWTRVFMNGYDVSGFGRSIGPLEIAYDEANLTTWTDAVKGYLKNIPHVNIGTFNGVFDNTATTGIHTLLGTAGSTRTVMVAMGIRAEATEGDPVFCGQFTQGAYQSVDDGGALTVSIPFQGYAGDATTRLYPMSWGQLLHGAVTAVGANAQIGFDNPTQAATTGGGYFIYQLLSTTSGAGTVTVSVQDSATNLNDGAFANLATPLSSGAIAFNALPAYGIVAMPPAPAAAATTIRRYARWQLAFAGGMDQCTFVSALVRG